MFRRKVAALTASQPGTVTLAYTSQFSWQGDHFRCSQITPCTKHVYPRALVAPHQTHTRVRYPQRDPRARDGLGEPSRRGASVGTRRSASTTRLVAAAVESRLNDNGWMDEAWVKGRLFLQPLREHG